MLLFKGNYLRAGILYTSLAAGCNIFSIMKKKKEEAFAM